MGAVGLATTSPGCSVVLCLSPSDRQCPSWNGGRLGREEGGCEGRSEPRTKGLALREPAEESWRWGQSWVWELQTETQPMELDIKRGLLGGPEAGG